MKLQTYISIERDINGNYKGFNRWSYKKLSTVISKLKKSFSCTTWGFLYKDVDHVIIHETDGEATPESIVLTITKNELLEVSQ